MPQKENKPGTVSRIKGKLAHMNVAQATRWSVYFVAIGLIAGLGSVAFHYLCQLGVHFFLDMAAGYRPPAPAGEHHLLPPTSVPFNRLMLLFLPALGGLVSGWLVYTFAPEAEGHGTDAAIDAIRSTRERFPEMLVGAGTVATPAQADLVLDAGVHFGVAPGLISPGADDEPGAQCDQDQDDDRAGLGVHAGTSPVCDFDDGGSTGASRRSFRRRRS